MPVPTLTSGPDWTFAQAGVTVDVLLEAVASGSTYHSQSQYCSVQLSDGTGVTLVAFGGYYFLLGTQAGKTGIQVFGAQTVGDTTNGAYCLAVDDLDQLYVVRGLQGGTMYLWQWIRSGPPTGNNSWTSTPGSCTAAAAQHTAMNVIWAGDGGAGHIIVTTEYSILTFVPGAGMSATPVDSHVPSGLASGPFAMAACGAGLGATSGIFVQTQGPNNGQSVNAAGWSISSGALTISAWEIIDATSGVPLVDDPNFAPHVRYAGGSTWFVLYPDTHNNLIANAVYTATAGAAPTNGAGLSASRTPAPAIAGVAHWAPGGLGGEVGTYAEFNITGASTSNVWVVTRAPGNASLLQRQQVKMTTGASPLPTWGLLAFTVANGMDNSSTSVVCPGEPFITQVDVVIGSVPGAVTAFAVSGTAVDPVYQPAAPVLTGPNYGAVEDNVHNSIPFSFTVDPDEVQSQCALVTQPWGGGSLQYWTGSEWTQYEFRQALPTPVGGIYTITVGTGEFVASGAAYGWYVLTWDAKNICSLQPFPRRVISSAAPSAALGVTSLATSLTIFTWTFTAGTTGAGQASFRVLIGATGWTPDPTTNYAEALIDSGTVAGPAGTWTVPAPEVLANGVTYDAYVLVTDVFGATNGPLSGVTPHTYTVTYSAITAPTLVATAPTDGSAVALVASGCTGGNFVEFQYSYDGATWFDVRDGGAVLATSTASVLDYDLVGNCGQGPVPVGGLFAATIHYRARQVIPSLGQISAWSTVESVTIPAWLLYWWLKDPLTPGLNAQVQVKPPWDLPIKIVASAYTELGASVDVVVSDGARGPSGELTFITVTPSSASGDFAELLALLLPAQASGGAPRTLLLQGPYGDSYYMAFTDTDDISTEFSSIGAPLRETKLKYTNVARP